MVGGTSAAVSVVPKLVVEPLPLLVVHPTRIEVRL